MLTRKLFNLPICVSALFPVFLFLFCFVLFLFFLIYLFFFMLKSGAAQAAPAVVVPTPLYCNNSMNGLVPWSICDQLNTRGKWEFM